MNKFMLPCVNKTILGVDCLGCGTQRAIVLIFQGNFMEAFYMFPAIYTLLLFFCISILSFIDTGRNYSKIIIGLAVVNAIIMIISYLIKHIF